MIKKMNAVSGPGAVLGYPAPPELHFFEIAIVKMFRAVAALVIRGRRFRLIGLQAVIPFEAVFDTVETKYQDLLLATMRTCQVKTKRQIGSVFEHFDMTFAGNGRRRTKNRLRVRCPFNSNERQFDGRALAFAFFGNFQRPAVNFVTLDNLFR